MIGAQPQKLKVRAGRSETFRTSDGIAGTKTALLTTPPGGLQMQKPRLSFWQIFNMSLDLWASSLGGAYSLPNMSGIYTYLGASPDAVPLLWLADR